MPEQARHTAPSEGTKLHCPKCLKTNICGHVEHDRIVFWSCDDCAHEWPRGTE